MNYTKVIMKMVAHDQEMRHDALVQHDEHRWDIIDRTNCTKLSGIIKCIGWPTISKVGVYASEGAWLLAQHADHDVTFQECCLGLMCQESDTEVSEVNIAFLHDRICVNRGVPQFYGTQFTETTSGAYGPRPIWNPESVDERRAAIGLEPIAQYKRHLMEKYNMPQKFWK